jgi:hypothetical protein
MVCVADIMDIHHSRKPDQNLLLAFLPPLLLCLSTDCVKIDRLVTRLHDIQNSLSFQSLCFSPIVDILSWAVTHNHNVNILHITYLRSQSFSCLLF